MHFFKKSKKKAVFKGASSKRLNEPLYKTLKTFHEDFLEVSESFKTEYFDKVFGQILKETVKVEHKKKKLNDVMKNNSSSSVQKKPRVQKAKINFKIDIIGTKGVGISTLVNNYTHSMFPDSYLNTVGVDFYTKEFVFNEGECIVQFWAHSNDIQFKLLRATSLVGSNGMIIVYDVMERDSLEAIHEWIPLLRAIDSNIPIMLLGNKLDLNDFRQIPKEEIEVLVKIYNIQLFYEISALTGTNVDFAFNKLLLTLLERDIDNSSIERTQIASEKIIESNNSYTKEFPENKEEIPLYNERFKIFLLGELTGNKISLTHRFLTNISIIDLKKINGVDFEVKTVKVDGEQIMLQIWDFKDKKRFKLLLPKYGNGVRGGLLVFDITKSSTLRHIDDWLRIIKKKIKKTEYFPIMLVGLTSGSEKDRQISTKEGLKIAKSRGLEGFIECNVDTGENVEKVFEALIKLIFKAS